MPQQSPTALLFQAHIQSLRTDWDRVLEALSSPKLAKSEGAMLVGRFQTILNPLRYELRALETRASNGAVTYADAWKRLGQIKRRSERLLEEAQGFLGGLVIRRTTEPGEAALHAQRLVDDLTSIAGVEWSPVVIIGPDATDDWEEEFVVEKSVGDTMVRIPFSHANLWYLPLVAHNYGYWLAKRDTTTSLGELASEQAGVVRRLFDEPPPTESQVAVLLPEVRELWQSRAHAGDAAEFRERHDAELNRIAKRQQVHLWHLIADAFATYFLGPVYAYAFIFLVADPTDPYLEGERAADAGRSRYVPADARRVAIILHTLQVMNERTKADRYAAGLFASESGFLDSLWKHALTATGKIAEYAGVDDAAKPWGEHICDRLANHFAIPEGPAAYWRQADDLIGVLRNGAGTPQTPPGLLPLLSAAWWCRPRYYDRIAALTGDCRRMLSGTHPPTGLHAEPTAATSETERLLHSRLYDMDNHLERIQDLFRSEQIDQTDRDAVSGRIYRLLSEQDYGSQKLRKFARLGTEQESVLSESTRWAQGHGMRTLRREVFDFLGGTLLRREGLDQESCQIADALLRDYARLTGANWASRSIPGRNPLFSLASDMIHVRFPDWEVWNFPLIAHEFGHPIALATEAFQDWLSQEIPNLTQGHPEIKTWGESQVMRYRELRGRHLHEFFADAFAVYCQGPAFGCDVIWLNFDPMDAYTPRGYHPTHAERVDVILAVLERMNAQERRDAYDAGPYGSIIGRLRDTWSQAIEECGGKPDAVCRFHQLKAISCAAAIYERILNRFYRFGAQYRAAGWERAEALAQHLLVDDPDLSGESLRDLLNIAWACRVAAPESQQAVAQRIRSACLQRARAA